MEHIRKGIPRADEMKMAIKDTLDAIPSSHPYNTVLGTKEVLNLVG